MLSSDLDSSTTKEELDVSVPQQLTNSAFSKEEVSKSAKRSFSARYIVSSSYMQNEILFGEMIEIGTELTFSILVSIVGPFLYLLSRPQVCVEQNSVGK